MRRIAMILKKRIINSSEKGLKKGWTRDTFVLRKDYLEKIRALAYWKRKKVKEVIDEALESYLEGKRVKPIGNERR
jgi:DNA-binding transcriptional regulator GbsR (MarR family)